MTEISEVQDAVGPQPVKSSSIKAIILRLLAGIVVFTAVAALILPAKRGVREASRRTQCEMNLKQIAFALHQYAKHYKSLPPAFTVNAQGKRLHSWRTLLLPYLDRADLYELLDLSKPWDDPVNSALFHAGVLRWSCPNSKGMAGSTTYLAVVSPNGCFRTDRSVTLDEITDRLSTTLLIVEVPQNRAVPWMSPTDIDESDFLGIGSNSKQSHTGGMHSAYVDGSVRLLMSDVPTKVRRALVSIAGNDDDVLQQTDF